jgi:hypothetical protein
MDPLLPSPGEDSAHEVNRKVKLPKFICILLLSVICAGGTVPVRVAAFSFSESEEQEKRDMQINAEERAREVQRLRSVPCDEKLKKKKIALIIGQHVEERGIVYEPNKYGPLFQEINRRLRDLGLRTYTQEEIRAQIAAEEVRAFLNNDVEAAESAARRLSAGYILRGMIRSKVRLNPVVRIDEVFVTMAFTLVDSSGRTLSNVTAGGDSFSGADPMAVALDIVKSEADLAVAKIYSDFCRHGSK